MEPSHALRRSVTDRKLAGVCAMLAGRWGIDPVLVRLLAVLLALSSGVGVILYAAAWLAIPADGSDQAALDRLLPGVRRLSRPVQVGVLIAACLIGAVVLHNVAPLGIGPAIVLGVVWYVGYRRRRMAGRQVTAEPQPGVGAAVGHVTEQGSSLDAFLAHPDPVGLYAEPPAAQARPVDRPARRRGTGRMHLIGAILTLTAVAAVAVAGSAYELPWVAYPAAALLGVGATLIVGAWLPRPRGLVPLALVLTVVTGFGAVSPALSQGEHKVLAYASPQSLPSEPVVHEVGDLQADLSRVPLDRDRSFTAEVTFGRLIIIVPPEANVLVESEVGAGTLDVLGVHRGGGVSLSEITRSPGTDRSAPTLTIKARVPVGTLEVRR